VVGEVIMALAALLEGLQASTPDRSAYLPAIFYGAAGALAQLSLLSWSSGYGNGNSTMPQSAK
jgi:hypothetical protein